MKRRTFNAALFTTLSLAIANVAIAQTVKTGKFDFSNWEGPALQVYYAEPENSTPDTPIVIVMHGAARNPDDYRDNWVDLVERYGFAVYAPEFDRKRFPKSKDYNLGGLTKDKNKAFEAIEPLFDTIKARHSSSQKEYYLFGHSAGGQFVHRYVFFGKAKRLKLALAANSGWYTLPTKAAKWPYGLDGLKNSRYDVDVILKSPLTIMLGEKDNDPDSEYLRHTPEADAQGLNRYERGIYFLKLANTIAKQRRLKPKWSYNIVPGVAHDNRGMAIAAAALIQKDSKEE